MYDTATRSQFIDLRARGWSYDKISRHTGISKGTLINWGREWADDIARLKSDYLANSRHEAQDFRLPHGPAQESYFHNLEGYADGRDATPLASVRGNRTKRKPQNLRSSGVRKFRKFLRSPLVRAAIRYAIFKH